MDFGFVEVNTTDQVYTVEFVPSSIVSPIPVISLVAPNGDSTLFAQAVCDQISPTELDDVTSTVSSFQVILSGVPTTEGYFISWHLNSDEVIESECVKYCPRDTNDYGGLLPTDVGDALDILAGKDASEISYLPVNPGAWGSAPPTTIAEALDIIRTILDQT